MCPQQSALWSGKFVSNFKPYELCYITGRTWQALGHHAEGQPTAKLVRVVGARHQIEEGRERVQCGYWHLAHRGAWWSQVPKSDVDTQVPQLT